MVMAGHATVNQAELRRMAEERIRDARALLASARWEFAYDSAGYAVECALKSCILARMVITGWVFNEQNEMPFQGAVGYSTALWAGEKEEDIKHAHVRVLLEIDPQMSLSQLRSDPSLRALMIGQANEMADEMFKARNPHAEIMHNDELI